MALAVRPIYIPGRPLTAKNRQVINHKNGLPSLGARRGEGPVISGGGMPMFGNVRVWRTVPNRTLPLARLEIDALLDAS